MRAPGQETFFQLALGGPVAAVTTTDDTLLWDTDRETVREYPQAAALAVRPDGRVYVAADDKDGLNVYDLASSAEGDPTPIALFSVNDQSVPLLAFSHDGSLLAESRRSWVALWDLRDPAAPRRLAIRHATSGEPTALAVVDDGRVLSGSTSEKLSVWDALGDGTSRTLVPGATDSGVQHLVPDAAGRTVLIDYPAFEDLPVVDLDTGGTVGAYHAADPSLPQTPLPPISWTTSQSLDGQTVASFDLAGRGFVFDTAAGDLLTDLSGGHTSLVSEAFFNDEGLLMSESFDGSLRLWDPRAADEEVSGALDDDLCRVFGSRIDADSWQLAFGDDEFDPACSAESPPAPAELKVSTSADVGAVPPVGTPRTVVLRETFDAASSLFSTGQQSLATGTVTTSIKGGHYRMEVDGVGAGYTAWMSTAVTGVGDPWAVSVTPGQTLGACGLYMSDGKTQLVVTLDRATGTGLVGWFNLSGQHPQRALHRARDHRRRPRARRRPRRSGGAGRRPQGGHRDRRVHPAPDQRRSRDVRRHGQLRCRPDHRLHRPLTAVLDDARATPRVGPRPA